MSRTAERLDPSTMHDDDLIGWIDESARELAEISAVVGARTPVPACPGWTMRQLVAHVISGLSGWYTHNLTYGASPLDYAASWRSQPDLPRGNADRLVRLVESSREFAELVGSVDLDAPCHVFQSVRTARAWLLRAATETAIHVRDAQEVLGEPAPWPAERAGTSIDETIRVMWHGALLLRGDLAADRVPDQPIVVIATDLERAWRVAKGADDFVVDDVEPAVAGVDAPVSVAGPSADLVPWLWNRVPTSTLTVTGELSEIDAWNLSGGI